MKILRLLANCVFVEIYKLSHTLALLVALGIPLFIVLLSFIIFYSDGEKLVAAGSNPWIVYTLLSHKFWAGILLSLTIVLSAALVNAIEHRNDTWKRLFCLPIPRWMIYFSKLIVYTGLNFLSVLMFFASTQPSGRLFSLIRPQLGFGEYNSFPVEGLFLSLKLSLAGLAIIAFQFYLSFRFQSFVLPLMIGFCLTVVGGIVNQWQYIEFIPYAYPFLSFNQTTFDHITLFDRYCGWSFCLFCIVSLAGYWESTHRNVY